MAAGQGTPGERSDRAVGHARLHFLILTYGALDATRRCLRSLAATVDEPFTVFVVDNASRDGTAAWLRSRREPWLHWQLNAENRGVPGGRNDLLDFAWPHLRPDDWLVFCDNDLEFGSGWLQSFRAAMARHPDARVLGKAGHWIEVRERDRVLLPAPVATAPVDVVSGGFACWVRVDAARAIGRFDEQLGLFWHEDDDFCVRALQHGFGVVAVPEARIVHHEHQSGVANAGLREGGSRHNQAYLAQKWRAAGWIDEGGWVRRAVGLWQPTEVRRELQRRGALPTPIGRLEFAAAVQLLDRLVGVADPATAFVRQREPVPRCLPALLDWNRQCAGAAGESALAQRLASLAAVLERECFAQRLQAHVRVPEQVAGRVGHGLCASADFDDPAWLAIADELEPSHCLRDPHARDRIAWENVSVLLSLECAQALRPGVRVLLAGSWDPRIEPWLVQRGALVERLLPSAQPRAGASDLVLVNRVLDPDRVAGLRNAGQAEAIFAFAGDVAVDGAPRRDAPQPLQLEHDLLHRAGLEPLWPVRSQVEPAVLEACAGPSSASRPQLSVTDRGLITSFVLVARPRPTAKAAVFVPVAASSPRWTVGVDLRTVAIADSSARGIGHYTVHHLAAVARRARDLQLVCHLPADAALPAPLRLAGAIARDVDAFDARACDLAHLPDPMNMALGFDSPLRVFRHERTTITFHDLTPLRHYIDSWFDRLRDAYHDRLRQIQSSQAVLLCNSRYTADDVVDTLGLDPARAVPILAGLNGGERAAAADAQSVRHRLGIRGDYVLHVGALDPHKNFAAALSAFMQVRQRRPLQLVVVGAVDPGVEHFAAFCRDRGVSDVVWAGWLPRLDLDALYARASALLFMSRSEGFGFPLLEAMAAGCPVIGTDVTSHPEVVGEAGQLVPVDDPAAAAAALERLCADPALAAHCRAAGLQRARQFTWDAVADRTLVVWRRLLAGSSPAQACTPGASMPVFSTHST